MCGDQIYTCAAGSGFKSKHAYRNGYFATRIKLPAGYTAGTNTAFYVSTQRNNAN